MISLSSGPKAEYDAFMKSMKRKSRIVPEFQPFSIHQNYVGGSLSRLDDEIAFLEERKESKAIRRGKRLERWLSCDEDDLDSNAEWFRGLRNLLMFGAFLAFSKWAYHSHHHLHRMHGRV